MPAALRKRYPDLDLPAAQAQVRIALQTAFASCGGLTDFLRQLNQGLTAKGEATVTQQSLSWWLAEGTFVNRRFWVHFETITDMAVTRRHLRPDIYGVLR